MKKLLLSLTFLLYTLTGSSQFFEGFENAPIITGPLPATWSLESGDWTVFEKNFPSTVGTTERWGINAFATGLQFEGTNCASISREGIGQGNTSEDYLVTPAINIPATGVSELHFYARSFVTGNQQTDFRILVALASSPVDDPSSYIDIADYFDGDFSQVYQEKVITLPSFMAGQSVYIAFVRRYQQHTPAIDGDRWLIDNVGIVSENPCNFSVTAAYSSGTTVDMQWSANVPNPAEIMILPCSNTEPLSMDAGIPVSGNSYQFTNLIPNTCYKVYIKSTCAGASGWLGIDVSYNLPPIQLVAFIDENNNGIRDLNEVLYSNGHFTITPNNSGITSNVYSGGSYSFRPSLPTDTFDFGFAVNPFYENCVTLGTVNYDDIPVPATAQTLYFPVVPILNCFDIILDLYSPSAVRPDMNHWDGINIYTNSSAAPSSGTITYTKPANVSIVSVTPSTGVTFTPTGFTYDYSGLSTTQYRHVSVTKSVPNIPIVNLGDLLTNNASVAFSPSDVNLLNNSDSSIQRVVASYDPNDISESHGPQIQFDQFGADDYLYYTIRFQNTGNANAIKVRVDDVLDTKIDPSSVNMISSSHEYMMVKTNSTLSWEFNNIQLPPASENEALSNGFIKFRVKPKTGYAIGDIIPSSASIYFDSNPAIITNTFNTEFVQELGNPVFDNSKISLSPNPASEIVTISNNDSDIINSILITDITGKKVFTANGNIGKTINISVSDFSKGLYFVKLSLGNNHKITKKLIVK